MGLLYEKKIDPAEPCQTVFQENQDFEKAHAASVPWTTTCSMWQIEAFKTFMERWMCKEEMTHGHRVIQPGKKKIMQFSGTYTNLG